MNTIIKSQKDRSTHILKLLSEKFPGKKAYDLDGRGLHFVCEVEPVEDHSEYDKAVEVIISSKPHVHHVMTQLYTILQGSLELHVGDKIVQLKTGDTYTVKPNNVHWAQSDDVCWLEIYSKPGWTKEDHILIKSV